MSRNKIVLLGTTHTGKTSIVQRYVTGQFHPDTVISMQAALFKKAVKLKYTEEELEIWDTAGQERFRSLGPMYYQDAKAALVVFDVTDANSFSKAKQWINELKSARSDSIMIVLVGNKADLQFIRVVQAREAREYAKSFGYMYFETSAKTGINIEQMFYTIAEHLYETRASEFDIANVECFSEQKSKKSSCC